MLKMKLAIKSSYPLPSPSNNYLLYSKKKTHSFMFNIITIIFLILISMFYSDLAEPKFFKVLCLIFYFRFSKYTMVYILRYTTLLFNQLYIPQCIYNREAMKRYKLNSKC